THRRRRSWRWGRAPSCTWSKRPPVGCAASRFAWPKRWPWPPCTAPPSSTGPWGRRPWWAASTTATWNRSSCTAPTPTRCSAHHQPHHCCGVEGSTMTAAKTTPSRSAVIDDVVVLCRRLRLKYVREQAPEVMLTARAQRWDPAEALRVLLAAEAQGRDRSTIE